MNITIKTVDQFPSLFIDEIHIGNIAENIVTTHTFPYSYKTLKIKLWKTYQTGVDKLVELNSQVCCEIEQCGYLLVTIYLKKEDVVKILST